MPDGSWLGGMCWPIWVMQPHADQVVHPSVPQTCRGWGPQAWPQER